MDDTSARTAVLAKVTSLIAFIETGDVTGVCPSITSSDWRTIEEALATPAPGAPGQEAAAILATFAHEILMGAIRPAERIKAARTALERAGMLSLETVVAASASKEEAAAVQAVGAEATTDELIALAEALERRRCITIAETVKAEPRFTNPPFTAGYELACEEIAHRIEHEEWVFADPAALPAGAGEKTS